MDEEVEVLEDTSEVPGLLEIAMAKVPVQQIVVNGQVQVIEGEVPVLICPYCQNVVQRFQPGIPYAEILQGLCTDNEEDLKATIYCSKCGQRLNIMRPVPIDLPVEEAKLD